MTDGNSFGEPIWQVEIAKRDNGEKTGELSIGVKTGAVHAWQSVGAASHA